MPSAIGTGDVPPSLGSPSLDPLAARALDALDRAVDAWRAAPWRFRGVEAAWREDEWRARIGLPPVERRPEDPAARAWAILSDDERARYTAGAADWRAGLAASVAAAGWPSVEAYERHVDAGGSGLDAPHPCPAGCSLDTWEHLDTGNSTGTVPVPAARARGDRSSPPGHALADRLDRAARFDRTKAALGPLLRAAAGALAAVDPEAPGPVFLDRMADRVGECRHVRAIRDAGCGAVLALPLSCDVRLCPDCEASRSAAYVARVDGLAAAMRRPLSGTLTIPNVPPGYLGLGVDVLTDAFARLRRTALFAGGPCRNPHQHPDERPDRAGDLPPRRERCRHAPHRAPASRACASCGRRRDAHGRAGSRACPSWSPKPCGCARCMRDGRGCRRCTHRPVAGGVASVEVTWAADERTWHPHLHFVADSPYVPWRELRDAWRAATCDATRAAIERGALDDLRSYGYRRPERPGRVALPRCAHLADAEGRPADRRCPLGHGWRARDAERCPYRDRDMDAPCGGLGEPIAEPCRGASIVWVEDPRRRSADVRGAIREAIKYATKGLVGKDGAISPTIAADPLLVAELLLVLRNRRLVNGWGSFHGVTDDPEDAGLETVEVDIGEVFPVRVPRICPRCGVEGVWHPLGLRDRARVAAGAGGRLYWHPPDHPPPRIT